MRLLIVFVIAIGQSVLSFARQDELWEPKSSLALVAAGTGAFSDDIKNLFARADPEKLTKLKQHNHDTVAIYADWFSVIKGAKPDKNDFDDSRSAALSSAELKSFAIFMEERLQVVIPDWWNSTLDSARLNKSAVELTSVRPPIQRAVGNILVVPQLQLSSIEPMLTGTVQGTEFSVPDFLVPAQMYDEHFVSLVCVCSISKEEFICVVSDPIGWGAEIRSINLVNGELNWVNHIHGIARAGGFSGPSGPEAFEVFFEINYSKDNVVVLGTNISGLYCEAFDRTSGQRTLRFSTAN